MNNVTSFLQALFITALIALVWWSGAFTVAYYYVVVTARATVEMSGNAPESDITHYNKWVRE